MQMAIQSLFFRIGRYFTVFSLNEESEGVEESLMRQASGIKHSAESGCLNTPSE